MKTKQFIFHWSPGIVLVALFSLLAFFLGQTELAQKASLSPLILAILLGMLWGNTLHNHIPPVLHAGVVFSQKKLLRLGIVLYGFRLTFSNLIEAGFTAIAVDILVIVVILALGIWLGEKVFGLNRKLSILIASGYAICGAAAVLAVESTIKPEKHEISLAVATVVIFGTIAMFISPLLLNLFGADTYQSGLAIGATVHEVAEVVAGGDMMGADVTSLAIVVKLARVLMLLPVLIFMGIWAVEKSGTNGKKPSIWASFPWFALGFLAVTAFNSLDLLPAGIVANLNILDTFLLTMAMTALGIETNLKKISSMGIKPFLLAGILALILYVILILITLF